jgi:sugar fermentation stimulation protein A
VIIDPPFARAVLLRRYKRFLADLELPDGSTLTVHCPNTGAMTGCAEPGSEAWYSDSGNPNRKYRHTLEVVCAGLGRVGVNTGRANALVAEAIPSGRLAPLAGYGTLRREVKSPDGDARFDLSLQNGPREDVFVEVKSMTLADAAGVGYFPDAVSARALKHLGSLVDARQRGLRAVLVFCAQHTGIREARPAAHIDPAYAEALAQAHTLGVEVYAYGCVVEPDRIELDRSLPVRL